jgi:hypothetical protein
MLQLGTESDFPEEAIGAKRSCEFRVQNLQCHQSGVLEILRQVDRGHAAAAELALDRVASLEDFAHRGELVGHLGAAGGGGA